MSTLRAAVLGATGRMGRLVVAEVLTAPDFTLVAAWASRATGQDAGILSGGGAAGLAVCAPGPVAADVVIDFSAPGALVAAMPHLIGRPLVCGTTGLDDSARAALDAHARTAPQVVASNFSAGIAVLTRLVAEAAACLPDYDVEIVELHHRGKRDAPSGTALALGRAAAPDRRPTHGRQGVALRQQAEIGFHAVRLGDVVGEHTVWLAGDGERLQLGHIATDRRTFAAGALRAARHLVERPPGRVALTDLFAGRP